MAALLHWRSYLCCHLLVVQGSSGFYEIRLVNVCCRNNGRCDVRGVRADCSNRVRYDPGYLDCQRTGVSGHPLHCTAGRSAAVGGTSTGYMVWRVASQNAAARLPLAGRSALSQSTNENCLFLNVYTPLAPAAKSLPVMAWVHGGAYYNGAGSQYNGTALVQDGVIVVTMNYRLGYLGFLAHPALDAEMPAHASGDYGLMDQQTALRWVQTNIAAFGGDPTRVTLFGQSTGGQAVTDQLVSPTAAGLFQRLIVESGAFDIPLPTLAAADASGVTFANSVGCTNSTDAACLRALPVSAVLAAETAVTSGGAWHRRFSSSPMWARRCCRSSR